MSFEGETSPRVERRKVSDAPPFEHTVEDDDAADLGMILGSTRLGKSFVDILHSQAWV